MSNMSDWLSSITNANRDDHDDAMLRVYADLMNAIVARAKMGLSYALIKPSLEPIGNGSTLHNPLQVARTMIAMLKAENLNARLAPGAALYITWSKVPEYWNTEN